jgi:hypothetical protein
MLDLLCPLAPSARRACPRALAAVVATVLSIAAAPVLAQGAHVIRLAPHDEVPAVSSAASGEFRAFVDETSGTISYTLSYQRLQGDVRQAHIHLGQHGVNGGIMVWLCQSATNVDPTGLSPACPASGSVSGVIQATGVVGPAAQGIDPMEFAEVAQAIRLGVAYVNVHSSKFPAGELRGQLRDRH